MKSLNLALVCTFLFVAPMMFFFVKATDATGFLFLEYFLAGVTSGILAVGFAKKAQKLGRKYY